MKVSYLHIVFFFCVPLLKISLKRKQNVNEYQWQAHDKHCFSMISNQNACLIASILLTTKGLLPTRIIMVLRRLIIYLASIWIIHWILYCPSICYLIFVISIIIDCFLENQRKIEIVHQITGTERIILRTKQLVIVSTVGLLLEIRAIFFICSLYSTLVLNKDFNGNGSGQ